MTIPRILTRSLAEFGLLRIVMEAAAVIAVAAVLAGWWVVT